MAIKTRQLDNQHYGYLKKILNNRGWKVKKNNLPTKWIPNITICWNKSLIVLCNVHHKNLIEAMLWLFLPYFSLRVGIDWLVTLSIFASMKQDDFHNFTHDGHGDVGRTVLVSNGVVWISDEDNDTLCSVNGLMEFIMLRLKSSKDYYPLVCMVLKKKPVCIIEG